MKSKINIITLISILISLLPFGIYLRLYSKLPSKFPMHYNSSGVVDRFVVKSSPEVFIMCGFGIMGIIFMKLLSLAIIKSSKNATENNAEIVTQVMNITSFLMTVLFTVISIYFLVIATGIYKCNLLIILEISNIVSGLLAVLVGNYMPKFKQNNFSGFRTKSTLSDKIVWFKTQRFCGITWVIGGIIIILLSILLKNVSLAVSLSLSPAAYMLMVIISAIYGKSVERTNQNSSN